MNPNLVDNIAAKTQSKMKIHSKNVLESRRIKRKWMGNARFGEELRENKGAAIFSQKRSEKNERKEGF